MRLACTLILCSVWILGAAAQARPDPSQIEPPISEFEIPMLLCLIEIRLDPELDPMADSAGGQPEG